MPRSLNQLLTKLMEGNNLIGTYYRRAIEDSAKIRFDQLIVKTMNGGEYQTSDPAESKLFFDLSEMEGTGSNKGFCKEDNCYYYESFGNWQSNH